MIIPLPIDSGKVPRDWMIVLRHHPLHGKSGYADAIMLGHNKVYTTA
jgi:hypothetical protein